MTSWGEVRIKMTPLKGCDAFTSIRGVERSLGGAIDGIAICGAVFSLDASVSFVQATARSARRTWGETTRNTRTIFLLRSIPRLRVVECLELVCVSRI